MGVIAIVNRKVTIHYDSEAKTIKMTAANNVFIKSNGESKTYDPSLDVLHHEKFIREIAKECIEEMLMLVNETLQEGK